MGKTRTVHALPRLIRARRTRSQKDFGKDTCPRTRLSRRKSACLQSQARQLVRQRQRQLLFEPSKDSLITSMLYPPVPNRTSPSPCPRPKPYAASSFTPPTTSTPNVCFRSATGTNTKQSRNSPPAAMPPSTHKEDSTSWPQSSNLFPKQPGSQFRLVFKNTKENSIISSITLNYGTRCTPLPCKNVRQTRKLNSCSRIVPRPVAFRCPRTGFGHLGTSGGRRNPQLGRSRRRLGDSPHRNDSYWS